MCLYTCAHTRAFVCAHGPIVDTVTHTNSLTCASCRLPGVASPLCGLSTDAAAAAATIAAALTEVTLEQAAADHTAQWNTFWNASTVSFPDAPETEDFWFGAQYILNSAIPHAGQEQTPPGLYGPWGTMDNPGWHGDYTIDYNYEATFAGLMSSNHPELMAS
jgi:hypothetical protein